MMMPGMFPQTGMQQMPRNMQMAQMLSPQMAQMASPQMPQMPQPQMPQMPTGTPGTAPGPTSFEQWMQANIGNKNFDWNTLRNWMSGQPQTGITNDIAQRNTGNGY